MSDDLQSKFVTEIKLFGIPICVGFRGIEFKSPLFLVASCFYPIICSIFLFVDWNYAVAADIKSE